VNEITSNDIRNIPDHLPVLIAGPTASGKSALALEIAQRNNAVIINADALQVYSNWRVLSARPSDADEQIADHRLYGHLTADAPYSVGHWLREAGQLIDTLQAQERPFIIVGGTGLYFTALTQGLADIPAIPQDVRTLGDTIRNTQGLAPMIADLDDATCSQIDVKNPMRVQRAWEVQKATGHSIMWWQARTPAPKLDLSNCYPILFDVDKTVLNDRIEHRFQQMIAQGALDEAAANLATWDPDALSSKTIGAPELIEHLRGALSLDEACELATIATRQFAKRQRTWFKGKMRNWYKYQPKHK
jgi:tRNA dimethylallyltransferase